MNFIWSLLAGLVVWFITPFIAPLQGDMRLAVAAGGAALVLGILFALGRMSYRRVLEAAKTEAAAKVEAERAQIARPGLQVGVGVKAKNNVTVRAGKVRSSGEGGVEIGKDIDAGQSASIHANDVEKKP